MGGTQLPVHYPLHDQADYRNPTDSKRSHADDLRIHLVEGPHRARIQHPDAMKPSSSALSRRWRATSSSFGLAHRSRRLKRLLADATTLKIGA